jgi:hypothetical protein
VDMHSVNWGLIGALSGCLSGILAIIIATCVIDMRSIRKRKKTPKEHILCSAIHIENDTQYEYSPKNISTGLVLCGRRHSDCYAIAKLIYSDIPKKTTQGFLTNTNRYVERQEAYKIALAANQLRYGPSKDPDAILISEDLY